MGLAIGRLLGWKQEARIMLLGPSGAGKTAIVQKLKLDHVLATYIPTIGFNAETLEYNGISFSVLEMGGQGRFQPLLKHYLYGVQCVVFVVDSNDRERILEAKDLMHLILNEDEFKVRDPALLVFATKQDRPNAMSAVEVADKLGLQSLHCNRRWHIQSSCAISGQGLHEGMVWLCAKIQLDQAKAYGIVSADEIQEFGCCIWLVCSVM